MPADAFRWRGAWCQGNRGLAHPVTRLPGRDDSRKLKEWIQYVSKERRSRRLGIVTISMQPTVEALRSVEGMVRYVPTKFPGTQWGGGAMAEITTEKLLTELLKKADRGELPAKKADMLRHLTSPVAAGQAITEMQEELLRELGETYGIC